MKQHLALLYLFLQVAAASAEVRVSVQETNGQAWLQYQCTAGEVVRAFALDVTLARGEIIGISNYFLGESRSDAQGYGIFPAALRDHITIGSGTNINWDVAGYSPLAVVADNPNGTLPGLNSSGVTLEFGAVWDPAVPAAVPGPAGTLCSLHLSEPAVVSVAANAARGGVVLALPTGAVTPVFTGAIVGPAITNTTFAHGTVTLRFKGGELMTSDAITGPWTGTGNTNGLYSEPTTLGQNKFFRVRGPQN